MPYLFLALLLLPGAATAAGLPAHLLVPGPLREARPELLALALVTAAALGLAYVGLRRSVSIDERARALQLQLAAEREARACADQALAENSDALYRLVSQQEGLRDGERKRIARDLNAGLGSRLLSVRAELARLADNPEAAGRLDGALANVDGALAAVRAATGGLRALGPDEGLRPAVERSLRDHAHLTGLRYRFESGMDPAACGTCDRASRLAAFALLQEVLGDSAGFAQDELRVRLTEGAERIVLELEGGRTPGLALPDDLRERIRALGGRLELSLAAPQRPRVTLSLPVREPSEAA